MDMESNAYPEISAAVGAPGAGTVADIDAAVRRVLRVKFDLGLFDHPYVPEPKGPYRPTLERRELAGRPRKRVLSC